MKEEEKREFEKIPMARNVRDIIENIIGNLPPLPQKKRKNNNVVFIGHSRKTKRDVGKLIKKYNLPRDGNAKLTIIRIISGKHAAKINTEMSDNLRDYLSAYLKSILPPDIDQDIQKKLEPALREIFLSGVSFQVIIDDDMCDDCYYNDEWEDD